MGPDLALTLGLVLAVFAVPSVASALSDGRSPRISSLVVAISGGLVIYALRAKQGGYTLGDIPDAIYRTLSSFMG
ncbi:hypothetical protein ROJ8625_03934 [Roseivivax jejudonensis]|uniref:50S ribosomal protein L35 n=1 Tax=Roseivivax jejudonensis TaxID=1529041 RepID=A0A1X7A9K1_9RHOB|nr:hypothetical protein [Roseivivax jejudonensis]SLN73440.1 hypothetical protein ROJ8625_03934 [Roseivivax jejudonensis]